MHGSTVYRGLSSKTAHPSAKFCRSEPERESSVHPYCAAGKEGEGGFDNRGCAKGIIVIS